MLTSAAKSAAAARGRPRSASAVDHTSSPAPAHQSSRAPGDPCRARQKAYQNNEKRSQQQHPLAQTICTVIRTSSPAIATDATFGTQPVGTGSSDWPELTCSDDRRSGDTGLHAPTLAGVCVRGVTSRSSVCTSDDSLPRPPLGAILVDRILDKAWQSRLQQPRHCFARLTTAHNIVSMMEEHDVKRMCVHWCYECAFKSRAVHCIS